MRWNFESSLNHLEISCRWKYTQPTTHFLWKNRVFIEGIENYLFIAVVHKNQGYLALNRSTCSPTGRPVGLQNWLTGWDQIQPGFSKRQKSITFYSIIRFQKFKFHSLCFEMNFPKIKFVSHFKIVLICVCEWAKFYI